MKPDYRTKFLHWQKWKKDSLQEWNSIFKQGLSEKFSI